MHEGDHFANDVSSGTCSCELDVASRSDAGKLQGSDRATTAGDKGRDRALRAWKHLLKLFAVIMMVSGVAVFVWPHIDAVLTSWHMNQAGANYEAAVKELADDELSYQGLLSAVDEYNRTLDETGQAELRDAWSYTEPSFDLAAWGLSDGVYARLRVPAASIDMPLYLGATEDHLNAGAAHLTQTSLPVRAVEGVSANAVIAGHRGYRANQFFNNIVDLVEGDELFVDTPWGTVGYRVGSIAVIDPADIDAVKIQSGRTMLTLVTCHPLYENYQRYVVYCDQV